MIKAWARVGITQSGPNFHALDLTRLYDDSDETAQAAVDERTPKQKAAAMVLHVEDLPGVRKDSAQNLKHQAAEWKTIAIQMQNVLRIPDTPADIGLCDVAAFAWHDNKPHSTTKQLAAGNRTGSIDASTLAGDRVARGAAENEKDEAKMAKKRALLQAWGLCGVHCQCGKMPCAVAGLQQCKNCMKIQKSICGQRKCKESRMKEAEAEAAVASVEADALDQPTGSAAAAAGALPTAVVSAQLTAAT